MFKLYFYLCWLLYAYYRIITVQLIIWILLPTIQYLLVNFTEKCIILKCGLKNKKSIIKLLKKNLSLSKLEKNTNQESYCMRETFYLYLYILKLTILFAKQSSCLFFSLLTQIPPTNIRLLQYLLCMLWHIAQHASENKMSSMNLGVCIGPTLLNPGKFQSPVLQQEVCWIIYFCVLILFISIDKIYNTVNALEIRNKFGSLEKFQVVSENKILSFSTCLYYFI